MEKDMEKDMEKELFINMKKHGDVLWVIQQAYLVVPYIRHEDLLALISRIEEMSFKEFCVYLEKCKPKV